MKVRLGGTFSLGFKLGRVVFVHLRWNLRRRNRTVRAILVWHLCGGQWFRDPCTVGWISLIGSLRALLCLWSVLLRVWILRRFIPWVQWQPSSRPQWVTDAPDSHRLLPWSSSVASFWSIVNTIDMSLSRIELLDFSMKRWLNVEKLLRAEGGVGLCDDRLNPSWQLMRKGRWLFVTQRWRAEINNDSERGLCFEIGSS